MQATTNGTGSAAVVSYSYGTWNGNFNPVGTINGEFHPGPNGTFVFHLPRVAIGSPPDGVDLTNTWANTHASITGMGTGVYFTANADRAPNGGYGSYAITGTPPCPKKIK